ncbi:MAG: hypothetical protein JKX95_05740, partial [Bacteroidia bacterium]|nr:hypothetical protein [Bacteroidia bacterium]
FVPIDTTGGSSYLNKIFYTGVIHRFAFQYSDSKRNQLHEEYITKDDFISEYEVSESTFSDFVNYADENDVEKNWQHILKSKDRIQNNLKALIARQLWGNEGYYPIFNQNDAIIKKAIEYMGNKDLVLNAD